jgi:glycosyltransferase involved in cell wall biosynthesis
MIDVHLIVNVFNGEKYLEEALDSLIHQKYKNTLIHCFDNHSTDNTSEILKQYALLSDNVFNYRTPKHVPLVEARNHAIETIRKNTKGHFYFGFCDGDDLWEKLWVSSLMKVSSKVPDILLCNGSTLKGSETSRYNSCLSMARPSPFNCPVFIQSCLFSSNILQSNMLFFDEDFKIIYDTEFWIRTGRNYTYVHISDHLFFYRLHLDSMASNNYYPIICERWRILKKHNLSKIRFFLDFLRICVSPFVVIK